MFNRKVIVLGAVLLFLIMAASGCTQGQGIRAIELSELEGKTFAVPEGTMADDLVLSRFAEAEFEYYPTVDEACLAVLDGEADAAAYDEPILRNIVAKTEGLVIVEEMITIDNYGFAVQMEDQQLKETIDRVVSRLESRGDYNDMIMRWLPNKGSPEPMPDIELEGGQGTLRFGTAAITEPFSFLDEDGRIVGFDIELAMLVAQELDMQIEIIDMDFGDMIPSLEEGEVDMIGACITISEERAQRVLFSQPYYTGGIAAVVREDIK